MSTVSWIAIGTIALMVKPIASYFLYLSERRSGRSRAQIILARAGGPARLLANAKQAIVVAWALMLGPLVIFFMHKETILLRFFLFGSLEIFLIPTGLLLLWDSKQSRKIVENYNREELG
jgi:hypothetical protein